MAKRLEFKPKTRTPTDTLIDRLIQAFAGQTVNITIKYLRAKDPEGNVLGEVAVSGSDWSNHQISKTITISTAGTLACLSLDAEDGAELYRYDLSTPVDVNAGDSVSVTWTIGITLGTNCKAVENVLEVIEGISSMSLRINGMTFVSEGSAIKTYDSSNATVNVAPDTTNDKVTVSVTFTDPFGFSYDEITLINVIGAAIISLSASGTVQANVQTTVEVTVTVKKPA